MKIKALKVGMKEDRKERNIEIAKAMIKEKAEISFIIKVTGLNEEEIKKII